MGALGAVTVFDTLFIHVYYGKLLDVERKKYSTSIQSTNSCFKVLNGNYQLPRREELRSQCSLKKEHRSNENEMMGLSANVA